MLKEITRKIEPEVERELWVRAGGRCEFRGHNLILYRSPVTRERLNIAQKAHIYSFSPDGPRGRGPYTKNPAGLNDSRNLLLVCHGCHQTIDRDRLGKKYSAELLRNWKREHEARIERVTGVNPTRKSHVVLYASRIGEQDSLLQPDEAMEAIFPHRYPAEDVPINLSPKLEHYDHTPLFWVTEADHLRHSFERWITGPFGESRATHFSVFGLADIPLLVLLGVLFTDKPSVDIYQLHRVPKGWKWQNDAPRGFAYRLKRPERARGTPALVFSLSGIIDHRRVRAVLGSKVAIWEITVAKPHNDFLRSRRQLALFSRVVCEAMVAINHAHGRKPVHIFPAMPVACAIELGRARMPKADMPWVVYDQNNGLHKFAYALTIGQEHE